MCVCARVSDFGTEVDVRKIFFNFVGNFDEVIMTWNRGSKAGDADEVEEL